MQTIIQNTAVVLFTRTPQEELVHKNLLGHYRQKKQKQLYHLLVQHAHYLGQQTGLPFYVVDSTSQQGDTFGERLQHAFATFFAKGFTKVIAIGNDCAQLKPSDVLGAARQMQSKNAVLGPAQDGGVYLLGLDQELFAQQSGFVQINWQTTSVLLELQNWCASYSCAILPRVYSDLDNFQDLRKAFRFQSLPTIIFKFLAEVFSTTCIYSNQLTLLVLNLFTSAYSFRGPPVY